MKYIMVTNCRGHWDQLPPSHRAFFTKSMFRDFMDDRKLFDYTNTIFIKRSKETRVIEGCWSGEVCNFQPYLYKGQDAISFEVRLQKKIDCPDEYQNYSEGWYYEYSPQEIDKSSDEKEYSILKEKISYVNKTEDDHKYKCFVILPIGKKDTLAYKNNMAVFKDIICPCVENCGYNFHCFHADLINESGQIDRQVIEALRDADVIIADLRRGNPSVAYELGIRHAFFKRSILVCSNQTEHFFYTNHYRALEYSIDGKSNQEFYNKLASCISDIIKNPKKSDSPVSDALFSQIEAKDNFPESAEEGKSINIDSNRAQQNKEKEFHRLVAAGIQFDRANRFDLATGCFEDALKLKPKDINLHINLSIIYGEKIAGEEGKQKAIDHCKEALKYDPNNLSAKFNLAIFTNHIKGSSESMPIYLEAEKLIPLQGMKGTEIDGKINLFIGHDYRNKKDKKIAEDRYNKAIAILQRLANAGDNSAKFWLEDAKQNLKTLNEDNK